MFEILAIPVFVLIGYLVGKGIEKFLSYTKDHK